jgi:hypothetical protein
MESTHVQHDAAWNKGKLVGRKAPRKLTEIWGIHLDGRRLARFRHDGNDRIGVQARNVEPTVVANFYVKGVARGRNVRRRGLDVSIVEGLAVAAVAGDVVVLVPQVDIGPPLATGGGTTARAPFCRRALGP